MAELGSASFRIGVDIGDFKNKIEQLKTGFSKAGKTIEDHAQQIRKAGLGISAFGAAITGAFALTIKNTANLGDELDKTSIRTGVAVETLSSLQHVVTLTGGSFSDVQKGLQRLAKNLNDADAGLSTAKRSFEDLGINIYKADGSLRDVNDVMLEAADRISLMDNDTKAAALAFDIFGRSGNAMLPMLKSGSEGIREMQREAEELGGVMSTDLSKQSALLNDNLSRIGLAFRGLGFIISDALMPAINRFLDKSIDIIKTLISWGKENKKLVGFLTVAIAAIGGLAAAIGPVLILLPSMVTGIKLVGAALSGINPIFAIITTALTLFAGAWATNLFGIRDVTGKVIDGIGALFDVLKGNMTKFINGIANTIDTAREYMLKGQRAVMSLLGQETEAVDRQLAQIEENIKARNEQSAAVQVKTWTEYYNERQAKREEFTEKEKQKINELTQEEIDSAAASAAAHGASQKKVREIREMTTGTIVEQNQKIMKGDKERFDVVEAHTQREQEAFTEMFEAKLNKNLEYAEAMNMSLDEFETKSFDVYQKIKSGQADSLTDQERRMSEYVAKITGDEGFNKVKKEVVGKDGEGGIFGSISIDWGRHLDAMANATANKIMNSEMNFKSLRDIVGTVFDDIKNSILGTFRTILQEYIQNFIVNMIKATAQDLGGGLAGALDGVFGGLFGKIKSGISGLFGGGGAAAGGAGGAASGGGGLLGGITGAGAAGIAATVGGIAMPAAMLIKAIGSGKGAWNDLSPEQRAALIAERERVGRADYARSGGEAAQQRRQELINQYGQRQFEQLLAQGMFPELSAGNSAAMTMTSGRDTRSDEEWFNSMKQQEKLKLLEKYNEQQKLEQQKAAVQQKRKDYQDKITKLNMDLEKAGRIGDSNAARTIKTQISRFQDELYKLPSFQRGGNVMRDMLANLHKNEMVLPAELAGFIRRSAAGAGGGVTVNIQSGAVNVQGAGAMQNINQLADIISVKIADKVARRAQLGVI